MIILGVVLGYIPLLLCRLPRFLLSCPICCLYPNMATKTEREAQVLGYYAGSCNSVSEMEGFTEDEIFEILEQDEVYLCVSCGWWQHSGEIFLGHADDCEHDEMICGDCCEEV